MGLLMVFSLVYHSYPGLTNTTEFSPGYWWIFIKCKRSGSLLSWDSMYEHTGIKAFFSAWTMRPAKNMVKLGGQEKSQGDNGGFSTSIVVFASSHLKNERFLILK